MIRWMNFSKIHTQYSCASLGVTMLLLFATPGWNLRTSRGTMTKWRFATWVLTPWLSTQNISGQSMCLRETGFGVPLLEAAGTTLVRSIHLQIKNFQTNKFSKASGILRDFIGFSFFGIYILTWTGLNAGFSWHFYLKLLSQKVLHF